MTSATSLRATLRALRIELRILNDAVAERANLNPRDLDVLDVIEREGPCSPRDIATRTGLRAATLTGILARLEGEEWIARRENPSDRRATLLTSTERFRELRTLYSPVDDLVEAAVAEWSEDRIAQVEASVEQLAGLVRAGATAVRHPSEDGSIRQ